MKTCIHTVILNELDEYLKVWLDHHTKMVDHIFIFEDIGSHSHKHITDQYDNVTLKSIFDIFDDESKRQRLIEEKAKGLTVQTRYIVEGVTKIQSLKEYDWCFTLDIDEFITLQESYKAIPDVLSEFQDKVAVVIQWMNFGANGHIYKPNYDGRDYREFYTKVGEQTDGDKAFKITTKVCWNLNKIKKWNIAGVHISMGDWCMTNGKKDRKCITYEKMYLKHYVTRSWEEYLWKLYKRGMHCGDRHRKIKHFFQVNPDMMDRYDELIQIKDNILNV